MNHPIVMNWQAIDRYETLLQQAETERIWKKIKTTRLRPQPRFRPWLADRLIRLGQRLQLRPPASPAGRVG